jgi:hypothetical protein
MSRTARKVMGAFFALCFAASIVGIFVVTNAHEAVNSMAAAQGCDPEAALAWGNQNGTVLIKDLVPRPNDKGTLVYKTKVANDGDNRIFVTDDPNGTITVMPADHLDTRLLSVCTTSDGSTWTKHEVLRASYSATVPTPRGADPKILMIGSNEGGTNWAFAGLFIAAIVFGAAAMYFFTQPRSRSGTENDARPPISLIRAG